MYEPVIGLEIHVELKTASKMFCGCPADHFGREPNTITCPVCLGLPGALPVPNKTAVEWTIMLGLALGCKIPPLSKFDRKHYFYPDLPKGFQISQYDMPFAQEGKFKFKVQGSKFKVEEKTVRIRRVHLEEDTGKLLHTTVDGKKVTLVDCNRSGVPLVEIVTEPDFRSVEEADIFVKKLQLIVRYLDISDADMEKGSMRIEPSVSMRKSQIANENKLPQYRVEIKNINSFKFARKAIEYEIERQREMLERREEPTQQTRGFVEAKGITVAQREKEEAHDYRYFPEPDIPPMRWEESQILNLKSQIGELPEAKKERFIKEYGLSEYDATILVETRERAKYFESCLDAFTHQPIHASLTSKALANWLINKKVDMGAVSPAQLVDQISRSTQTRSVSSEELEKTIKHVLAENPKAVEDYKKGKEQALMFLVGHVMKETKGKCSAEEAKKRIMGVLKQRKEGVRI